MQNCNVFLLITYTVESVWHGLSPIVKHCILTEKKLEFSKLQSFQVAWSLLGGI